MAIKLSSSKAQTNRAAQLEQARKLFLQEALRAAITSAIDLALIDRELREFAPMAELQRLAGRGLRGELAFAVPSLLELKPNLLAYYRLLLGFSQKEFYGKLKLGRFSSMEMKGKLNKQCIPELPDLCIALNQRAAEMLSEIDSDKVTANLLHELSLLTLGAQLRGGSNNTIGQAAIRLVFDLIQDIVKSSIVSANQTDLSLKNAAGRVVLVRFGSDPDITIVEQVGSSKKKLVAIEIKGGQDISNIWNRLGEAEKSHQTAKRAGFTQFWTIVNVDSLDELKAREKTPTTQRFYHLQRLLSPTSVEFGDFKEQLIQSVGIPAS
jgi:hypothetical protein